MLNFIAEESVTLTPVQRSVLAYSYVDSDARVVCWCGDKRTRNALVRKGATDIGDNMLSLSPELICGAIESRQQIPVDDATANIMTRYLHAGEVPGDVSADVKSLCWHFVRCGLLTANLETMSAWDGLKGYVFRPVA